MRSVLWFPIFHGRMAGTFKQTTTKTKKSTETSINPSNPCQQQERLLCCCLLCWRLLCLLALALRAGVCHCYIRYFVIGRIFQSVVLQKGGSGRGKGCPLEQAFVIGRASIGCCNINSSVATILFFVAMQFCSSCNFLLCASNTLPTRFHSLSSSLLQLAEGFILLLLCCCCHWRKVICYFVIGRIFQSVALRKGGLRALALWLLSTLALSTLTLLTLALKNKNNIVQWHHPKASSKGIVQRYRPTFCPLEDACFEGSIQHFVHWKTLALKNKNNIVQWHRLTFCPLEDTCFEEQKQHRPTASSDVLSIGRASIGTPHLLCQQVCRSCIVILEAMVIFASCEKYCKKNDGNGDFC